MRLGTHCLVQFGAYLAVPNPLGGQLVPGHNCSIGVLVFEISGVQEFQYDQITNHSEVV